MHAIGAAHNLLSALVDNHMHWSTTQKTLSPETLKPYNPEILKP